MTHGELQLIAESIIQVMEDPTVGGKLGYTGEYSHIFMVSNTMDEKMSHFCIKIDNFQDAIEILNHFGAESETEAEQYLKKTSNYKEDKTLYFHYIKQ